MCYGLFESFFRGFLLWLICHDFSVAVTNVHDTFLNSSEEIKNIFSSGQVIKNPIQADSKGAIRNRSFTEGGVIDVNVVSTTDVFAKKQERENINNTRNVSIIQGQNITSLQRNSSNNKIHTFLKSSTDRTLQHKNLTEPQSDLFLGVPEVIHINGASSIKPRKGVDNENKENYSFLSNYSCFWLSKNDCYYAKEGLDLKCTCCNKSNTLGEIFKQQASVNCDKCKPISLSDKDKLTCTGICCKDVFQDIISVSTTQDEFAKLKNNSKTKPTITKVPYDVEVLTEILSKSKQKVFLPVVVSLLLLPVIGIFIFLIWRRTKEYWDKRFYKRMDFLIDGMYND